MTRWVILFAAATALAACSASPPVNEMPATTTATPAATQPAQAASAPEAKPSPPLNAEGLPLERHEASGQCWMRYDKTPGSLETKAKLVEKCINDKMAGIDTKDAKKKPSR